MQAAIPMAWRHLILKDSEVQDQKHKEAPKVLFSPMRNDSSGPAAA